MANNEEWKEINGQWINEKTGTAYDKKGKDSYEQKYSIYCRNAFSKYCISLGPFNEITYTSSFKESILLIIFPGELVSNWYPVSIFEEPKSLKSLMG